MADMKRQGHSTSPNPPSPDTTITRDELDILLRTKMSEILGLLAASLESVPINGEAESKHIGNGWRTPGRVTWFDWIRHIFLPLLILGISVCAGSFITTRFQNDSFRLNERFKVKIDRIIASEHELRELRASVDVANRRIRLVEADTLNAIIHDPAQKDSWVKDNLDDASMGGQMNVLLEDRVKLEALKEELDSFGLGNRIQKDYEAYLKIYDGYNKFLQDGSRFTNVYKGEKVNDAAVYRKNVVEPGEELKARLSNIMRAQNAVIDELVQSQ